MRLTADNLSLRKEGGERKGRREKTLRKPLEGEGGEKKKGGKRAASNNYGPYHLGGKRK